jgi:hypothetical protein
MDNYHRADDFVALTIDRFGVLGLYPHPLSPGRVIAVLLTVVGFWAFRTAPRPEAVHVQNNHFENLFEVSFR